VHAADSCAVRATIAPVALQHPMSRLLGCRYKQRDQDQEGIYNDLFLPRDDQSLPRGVIHQFSIAITNPRSKNCFSLHWNARGPIRLAMGNRPRPAMIGIVQPMRAKAYNNQNRQGSEPLYVCSEVFRHNSTCRDPHPAFGNSHLITPSYLHKIHGCLFCLQWRRSSTTVFTSLGITLTIEGSEQCDPAGRMRPLSGLAIRSKYRVKVPR
jgi:hypothetical protein